MYEYTLQIPWLEPVQVDLTDDFDLELLEQDFLLEIVVKKLLVSGVEAEARRHTKRRGG